jgi:hypothetical protein
LALGPIGAHVDAALRLVVLVVVAALRDELLLHPVAIPATVKAAAIAIHRRRHDMTPLRAGSKGRSVATDAALRALPSA